MKKLLTLLLVLVFTISAHAFPPTPLYDQSAVTITGGTINGTTVGATTPGTGKFTTLEAATIKATTGAGAGKILTSDADGDATWGNAPAGTVPDSGTSTTAIMQGDGAHSWSVKEPETALGYLLNPKAMSQGVAMTAAASGSTGITVADNDNIDFGTGNFTLVWKGSLPDWSPAATQTLIRKYTNGESGLLFRVDTDNILLLTLYNAATGTNYASTVANTFIDGTAHEITIVVTRESVSVAGSVVYYVDGVIFGAAKSITAGAPYTISNTRNLYLLGTDAIRTAGTTHHAYTFNRALTAAEVLDLYRNGIAAKHRKAAQTALTSGTLVAGQEYTIDTFVAGDDFANVGGTNVTGNVFAATGTTPTTWTNSSSLRATGGTLILEPEGIQPVQWLDAGANRLHAMQPAAGSSLTRSKRDFTIKWTNTWTASSAAQYVGGLNQAVLSADHFITDIITQATVTTDVENLTLGDGSDADRFVTAFAPSATRTKQTVAAQNDGTNLKLVYTPAAEATMTVETIIRGFIWEP